jgi:hypothetical protein
VQKNQYLHELVLVINGVFECDKNEFDDDDVVELKEVL